MAVEQLGETAVLARGQVTDEAVAVADGSDTAPVNGAGRRARKPGHRLALRVVGPVEPARHAIEGALERLAKRWAPVDAQTDSGGGHRLQYSIRCRKRLPAERFATALREELGAFVVDVDLAPER
jgi:hypothetical protein